MALSYSTAHRQKIQRLVGEIADLEWQIQELGFPRTPAGYRKLVLYRARLNQQRIVLEQVRNEPFETWLDPVRSLVRPVRRKRRQS